MIRLGFALVAAAGLTAATRADDKKPDDKKTDSAKLIVGKWEATKSDPGTLPVGSTVEFAADGKVKFLAKEGGKEETIDGTYSVDGNVINLTAKVNGQEHKQKLTIKKLTDAELEIVDPDNKGATLKRKK